MTFECFSRLAQTFVVNESIKIPIFFEKRQFAGHYNQGDHRENRQACKFMFQFEVWMNLFTLPIIACRMSIVVFSCAAKFLTVDSSKRFVVSS